MHVKELLDLSGNVILVTGGAGNYGKCIVEGMAEAGATVIIGSRSNALIFSKVHYMGSMCEQASIKQKMM